MIRHAVSAEPIMNTADIAAMCTSTVRVAPGYRPGKLSRSMKPVSMVSRHTTRPPTRTNVPACQNSVAQLRCGPPATETISNAAAKT